MKTFINLLLVIIVLTSCENSGSTPEINYTTDTLSAKIIGTNLPDTVYCCGNKQFKLAYELPDTAYKFSEIIKTVDENSINFNILLTNKNYYNGYKNQQNIITDSVVVSHNFAVSGSYAFSYNNSVLLKNVICKNRELVSGKIIGYLKCTNTNTNKRVYGFFILTSKADSLLTFDLPFSEFNLDTNSAKTGVYAFNGDSVSIDFKPLKKDNNINYWCPAVIDPGPAFPYPLNHFTQANIIYYEKED